MQKLLLRSQPLNFLEKEEICKKSPWEVYQIYSSGKTAIALELFLFKERAPDTEGNAFGHCVLAGLLTKTLGTTAASNYLYAREMGKDRKGDIGSAQSREMDLSNNDVGIKEGLYLIESQNFSVEALARSCLDLLGSQSLTVKTKKFSLPIEYDPEAMRKVIQHNQ